MHDPLILASPKINQAIALLEKNDIINAIGLWREANKAHGKCAMFCENKEETYTVQGCAACFEGRLWNTQLHSHEGINEEQGKRDPLIMAQIIKDWLLQFNRSDA